MNAVALDSVRLASWLDTQLPGPAAPVTATQIEGGASNLIYRIERAGAVYALRRPPAVANDPTSNNMCRELRLLQALGRTPIPHPRLIAGCEDADIIGVPFALNAWIDGFTPKDPLPEAFRTPEAARAMAEELIDGLAMLAIANWQAIGLEGFGKPENFLQRQVDRWLGQHDRGKTRDLPGLAALAEWLRANTPQTQRVTLIHGDYQFINTMFRHDQPVRMAAIMDWESATIGDPLLDLGWLLAGWPEPGEPPTYANYIDWSLFPPRADLAKRYAQLTALSIKNLNFYMALAQFKLAIIMEGWFTRYKAGQTNHPAHAAMETGVPNMLARASVFAGIG